MPTERTLKAGDIVRLTENAELLTPVGYRVPFAAGDQFAVLRLDGLGTVKVRSLDGYGYDAPVGLLEFVRECFGLTR